MSETPDLSLVTGPDLLDELKRRHKAIVIIWEDETLIGERTETFCDWYGPLSYCIGLASRVHHRLLQKANERQ